MFRCAISALRGIKPTTISYTIPTRINYVKTFSSVITTRHDNVLIKKGLVNTTFVSSKPLLDICSKIEPAPIRTVIKFSLKKGKRKSVKAVVKKFFRLHWGGWIRTKVGRHKKIWKKSQPQRRRLRQHVFCNSTQSTLLDKMVTKYWKKPKHYVDDPYAPYHTREEFHITRKKPGNH